jgi:hypothetical protein
MMYILLENKSDSMDEISNFLNAKILGIKLNAYIRK